MSMPRPLFTRTTSALHYPVSSCLFDFGAAPPTVVKIKKEEKEKNLKKKPHCSCFSLRVQSTAAVERSQDGRLQVSVPLRALKLVDNRTVLLLGQKFVRFAIRRPLCTGKASFVMHGAERCTHSQVHGGALEEEAVGHASLPSACEGLGVPPAPCHPPLHPPHSPGQGSQVLRALTHLPAFNTLAYKSMQSCKLPNMLSAAQWVDMQKQAPVRRMQ